MRRFRAFVAAAVLAGACLGCSQGAKSSIPPPSPDDKPLGTPKGMDGAGKQRPAK
jgi:hypothetical protein